MDIHASKVNSLGCSSVGGVCLAFIRPWAQGLASQKMDMVIHTYSLSTEEVEAGESEI